MIEVSHLCKRYGDTLALDDASFSVETGSICGLLGPNGAGKSTTMNIMTGCLAATSGEVRYDGKEIYADMAVAKKMIGYLPEQPPLYPDMTPWEYLVFVGRAKGLKRADAEIAAAAAGGACGIDAVGDRLIKHLSKGYKQRVGIAQALIGSPEVIILDEPTVGLDPRQIIEIRDLIRTLAERRTVVISSHILSEIRALCDQIVIISKGRLVADDTPEQLESRLAGSRTTSLVVRTDVASVLPRIAALSGVANAEQAPLAAPDANDGCIRINVVAEAATDIRESLFRMLAANSIPVLEMFTTHATLEDVFIELTENDAQALRISSKDDDSAPPYDANGSDTALDAASESGTAPNSAPDAGAPNGTDVNPRKED